MSQVYTETAVRSGQIPGKADFNTVLTFLRGAIVDLHEQMPWAFPGATVFGSCAKRMQTVCSDIDLLVLVDDTATSKETIYSTARQTNLLSDALVLARQSFVQVSIYPVVLSTLRSQRTKNDRQFLRHVTLCAGAEGLICGNVEKFASFYDAAPSHTLERATSYIERKMEKLDQRLFTFSGLGEEEIARMYLDTYQAPFHALRKLFDLKDIRGYEDTKAGLIQVLHTLVGERYVFPLVDLMDRWQEYVHYIQQAKETGKIGACPFVIEDVHKALIVLNKVEELCVNTAAKRRG